MTPFDAPAFPATSAFPPMSAERAGADAGLAASLLADPLGRTVRYLRMSVTDRCDLRCVYCMPARMTFAPRPEVLSLEELERLAGVFIGLGARKLRLTGGEPLVRRDVLHLFARLGGRLAPGGGLDELTLTTNGTRLAQAAEALRDAGVRRVNVSLDSLDPETYRRLTRGGDLAVVLRGIEAAQAAGLAVKLNAVALARDNRAELAGMVAWAHARGMDVSFIEAMPLGDMGGGGDDAGADRADQHLSLQAVRDELAATWTLTPIVNETGGPARWLRVEETGGRLGLITPLSHTFCDTCNRVRLTATGVLHTCLGHDDATDLRAPLRDGASDAELADLVRSAVATKPARHDFRIARGAAPAVARHMSVTGG